MRLHSISFSVWIISLTIMPSRFIRVVTNSTIFLQLNKFHSTYIPVFFVHSTTDGHLGRFQTLAIVSNAAMNIWVQIPLWYCVLIVLDLYPDNGITGSYGNSIFNFWGTFILFSTVTAPIYIPTNSAREFPFPYIKWHEYFWRIVVSYFIECPSVWITLRFPSD